MKLSSFIIGLTVCTITSILIPQKSIAQLPKTFSHADSLRGSITPERAWWDLLHYDINIRPNIATKTIEGNVVIRFKAIQPGKILQIDLQQPLIMDSVLYKQPKGKSISLQFKRDGNASFISLPNNISKGSVAAITVFYHGTPREAKRAPWDGGISWKKDSTGAPYIATSCQGLGASVWWPCKDHQYDEPEAGVNINITVPDTLTAISNGRLIKTQTNKDHTKTFSWLVKNPINNYGVSMNIGKYILIKDSFKGEGGLLDLSYYVLPSNKDSAIKQFAQVKTMLACFEFWMGKYPFYEDGYKLVDVPYLGMEHQSNLAYGNKYQNGYLGRDLSKTGWGLLWDFIIVHESGHEWFGNNITSKDIADMWIHEGFTTYTETLFTQWQSGINAGNEYSLGIRKSIKNDIPIIGVYNVQNEGSRDMYPKAASMIHNIRMAMNNDILFRAMLRAMNKTFYHKTVTTKAIELFMSKYAGFSLTKTFDQYLRTTQVPTLEYYFSADGKSLNFRWMETVDGFDMPLMVNLGTSMQRIQPKYNEWSNIPLTSNPITDAQMKALEPYFYIQLMERKEISIKVN